MGCSSGKQGGDSGGKSQKLQWTKVSSIDDFLKQAQDLMDQFGEIVTKLDKQKNTFLKASGLELEPNQKWSVGVPAMFLLLGSYVESMDELKFKPKTDAPFMDVTISPSVPGGQKMWESFTEYVITLDEFVRDRMPGMLE